MCELLKMSYLRQSKARGKGGFWVVLEREKIPLYITTDSFVTTPVYPLSSFNSLTAAAEADSPGSTSPAGNSMTIRSRGARYCFWRMISGPIYINFCCEHSEVRIQ